MIILKQSDLKYKQKMGRAIFIPDIDKWEIWDKDIISLVRDTDHCFFRWNILQNGELNRDMSQIPHPFVEESLRVIFLNYQIVIKTRYILFI